MDERKLATLLMVLAISVSLAITVSFIVIPVVPLTRDEIIGHATSTKPNGTRIYSEIHVILEYRVSVTFILFGIGYAQRIGVVDYYQNDTIMQNGME